MEHIKTILQQLEGTVLTHAHLPNLENKSDIPATPQIKCLYCRDVGIVHPLKENGSPDYSRTVYCPHCVEPEFIRRSLGVSSMDSTFASFIAVPGSKLALQAAKAIASLKTDWKLLLIYGTWGCGKTHLIEAIALELWGKGVPVRVQTFPEFVDSLKATFDRVRYPEDTTFSDILYKMCSMPYLLLDDVGAAGSFTPWSLSQLERIILARYRDSIFTVITTNLSYDDLPPFVVSRFSDIDKGRIVMNEAADFRNSKGKPEMIKTIGHRERK